MRKPRLWDVKDVPRLTRLMGRQKPTLVLLADTVRPSAEEKRIYRLPVFTAPFCQALLQELEHFEQSDMPKGRPNTMNNYGVGDVPRSGRGGGAVGSGEAGLQHPGRAVWPSPALVSPRVK